MNHAPHPDLDDALREALRAEPAVADFRARMLAQARRAERPRRLYRPMLMAAAALLMVGFGAWALPRLRAPRGGMSVDAAVASASAELADPQPDHCFQGKECDGKGCGDWAETRAGFRAPLPACVAEADLSAGGACRIAGQPAAHYLLRDGSRVYVFAKPFSGCPFGERTTRRHGTLTAEAWNEEGRGYLRLARR